jgi:hypothetical protein
MKNGTLVIAVSAALLPAPCSVVCALAASTQSAAVNRLVTPNGDGYNDTFIFRCYNPRDAAVDTKIFDLSGRNIASMTLKSSGTSDFFYTFEWNPNSGGHWPGGVYLYQVRVENKVYKGTIVVIR